MWPAISWAVLDSASSRKLSWYAMREAYRPRVLHFSGVERRLILINDTQEGWSQTLKVWLVSESGELLESTSREVSLDARSQTSFNISELFASADVYASNGYLIAELDGIRTARRVLDKAVSKVCAHNIDLAAQVAGSSVKVHVTANCFIQELSLLPELVALDRVEVTQERITLLPGEEIDLVITCSNSEDAARVASAIEEITWSLNRLLNAVDLI
jgi:beta-mannosidase